MFLKNQYQINFFRDLGKIVGIASTSLNLQNGVTVNVGGLSTTRSELWIL